MPTSPTHFDALPQLRGLGFDDHECALVVSELLPGSARRTSPSDKRTYQIAGGDGLVIQIALNKHGVIKRIEVPAALEQGLKTLTSTAVAPIPPKCVSTTLFGYRPIAGYARVPEWLQLRPTTTDVVDYLPNYGDLNGGRPYPFVIETRYRATSLFLLDAYRRHRALNEAIWLVTAFLELPIFQNRSAYAYVSIEGKLSLAQCSAPHLTETQDLDFSDVTGLRELEAVEHETYFSRLGIGSPEFCVPDLKALKLAYDQLQPDDKQRMLRSAACLFDSANPFLGDGGRIVSAITAIEALMPDGEKCDKCRSHTGIGQNFRNFVRRFVSDDDRVLAIYQALYPARSQLAHGSWHPDVDAPFFGLNRQDAYINTLASWGAAKRGLVKWLLANGNASNWWRSANL